MSDPAFIGPQRPPLRRLSRAKRRALLLFIIVQLLLFFAPFVQLMLQGLTRQWVPTPEWLARISPWAHLAGLQWVLCVVYVVIWGERRKGPAASPFKAVVGVISICFLGYCFVCETVIMVVPSILTLFDHQPQSEVLTVDVVLSGIRNICSGSVRTEELPWLNEICAGPYELRSTLKHGDKIIVEGQGNAMGLFVHTIRRVPAPVVASAPAAPPAPRGAYPPGVPLSSHTISR